MAEAYTELRGAGFSFEQMAEANTDAMIDWKLGPLFDPEGFHAAIERRKTDLLSEWMTTSEPSLTPGSPTNRYLSFAERMSQTTASSSASRRSRTRRESSSGPASSLAVQPCAIRRCCAPRWRPTPTSARHARATGTTSSISRYAKPGVIEVAQECRS